MKSLLVTTTHHLKVRMLFAVYMWSHTARFNVRLKMTDVKLTRLGNVQLRLYEHVTKVLDVVYEQSRTKLSQLTNWR